METAVELDLPVDHRSVREAREFVANMDGLAPERLADARLITSELITNALLHAGLGPTDRILLTLSRYGNRLRIDVDDCGTFTADSDTFTYPAANHHESRGLRIVQTLTIRWQAENGRVSAWIEV